MNYKKLKNYLMVGRNPVAEGILAILFAVYFCFVLICFSLMRMRLVLHRYRDVEDCFVLFKLN
jgi:hypothetical protein